MTRLVRVLLPLVLLALAAHAAPPALSPRLGPVLGQLRTLTDAQDYTAALAALAPAIGQTKPDSYDRFILLQIQGRILISQNRFAPARDALEAALRIADAQAGYLAPADLPELLQTLAQLDYQIAATHPDRAAQAAGYRRALAHTDRWLAALPAPDAQTLLFSASLRYTLATLSPDQPDPDGLRAALAETRRGLLADLDPPAQLRLLAIAILQQLDRPAETIPHLELLVARQPRDAALWRQLVATYLTLADHAADRSLHLRAILALERAAAHDQLADSASRLNLVHAYLQVGGHEHARRLLAEGLRSGRIESTARTWQFLAGLDTEHGTPAAAIATLREALAKFPGNDTLALELARLHHVQGDTAEARRLVLAAAADPQKLAQPGRALAYLAYLDYELGDLDAAARHLDAASAFDDARPDDLARLRAALKQP